MFSSPGTAAPPEELPPVLLVVFGVKSFQNVQSSFPNFFECTDLFMLANYSYNMDIISIWLVYQICGISIVLPRNLLTSFLRASNLPCPPTWPKSYLGFAFDVANLCRQCRQQHWLAAKSCGHFSHASILKLKADIMADIWKNDKNLR